MCVEPSSSRARSGTRLITGASCSSTCASWRRPFPRSTDRRRTTPASDSGSGADRRLLVCLVLGGRLHRDRTLSGLHRHRVEKRHHRAELGADPLDEVLLLLGSLCFEPGAALFVLLDPVPGVRPVLDLVEDLLHLLAGLGGYHG